VSVRDRVINPLVRALLRSPAHHDRKRWWRNLQPPAPVQLWVAGRELHGTAQVLVDDPAQIADALTIFLARFPSARRALGVAGDASPTPSSRPLSTIIVVRIATDDHLADPRDTERV
jgi:hypothetical protein